ncbi:hypothetical protein LFL96_36785 (plasmid) [Paraburkholderia sp. D15]|uniref:hypothetical protein n=1 Tax=Paraburkholderia sp. D15 TaxID=2880218 RepID=UPI0024798312|nr:hypothetical protein [Paraburkholderia sp. D15]WGS55035.1 hypothetical protein LFL96_36785 [Paraburkholderia sp. D15]
MTKVRVQQFSETEDEFIPLGEEQLLNLTDDDIRELEASGREVIYLASHDGYFALLDFV